MGKDEIDKDSNEARKMRYFRDGSVDNSAGSCSLGGVPPKLAKSGEVIADEIRPTLCKSKDGLFVIRAEHHMDAIRRGLRLVEA